MVEFKSEKNNSFSESKKPHGWYRSLGFLPVLDLLVGGVTNPSFSSPSEDVAPCSKGRFFPVFWIKLGHWADCDVSLLTGCRD